MDSATSYAQFRAVRFFASLDGLRGLSILGVVWFHCWWGTPYYPILEKLPVLREGEFGVHIFYVLSGFLITTLLLRERERYGAISLRDFYMRRVLRIWPLYYATVVLYIFVVWKFEPDPSRARNFFHHLPTFATFTYTWFLSPKWPGGIFNLSATLATEEQFYAFWPLLMKVFRGIKAPLIMLAIVCLPVVAGHGWFLPWIPSDSFANRVLINISIPIGLGAILAHTLHSERGFRILYPLLGRRWLSPVATLLLVVSLIPVRPNFWFAWTATILMVGASVVREDHGLARVLKFRPLSYVGVVSYGMYLLNSLSTHVVRLTFSHIGIRNPVAIFPFGVGLTAAVASLSYWFYEKPFLALKNDRFSRQKTKLAHTPALPVAPQVSA